MSVPSMTSKQLGVTNFVIVVSHFGICDRMQSYTMQYSRPRSIASTMPQDVINFQVTHENYSYELLLFQVGHCRRPRAPGGCGGVRRWIVDGKEVSNLH